VNERELRRLASTPAPGERASADRVWSVVRAAHAEREPAPRRRGRLPLALGLTAAALVVAVVALTPPGDAFRGWVHDRIVGAPHARPALDRLPAPGRLLVVARGGAWVVGADGSKRRLGAWRAAGWSPRGLFVVAAAGPRLAALTPVGTVRWSLTRLPRIEDPTWSPSGYRVAYRVGSVLRVVAGDGTGDRAFARGVEPVPAAWRPVPVLAHVLAYVDREGRVVVADVDARRTLWRRRVSAPVRSLAWSSDGSLLLAAGRTDTLFRGDGTRVRAFSGDDVSAAFAPAGPALARSRYAASTGRSAIEILRPGQADPRVVFSTAGRLGPATWSPDGHWLLVAWPDADQWLFLRLGPRPHVEAVGGLAGEFSPGAPAQAGFPRVAGWCCSGS